MPTGSSRGSRVYVRVAGLCYIYAHSAHALPVYYTRTVLPFWFLHGSLLPIYFVTIFTLLLHVQFFIFWLRLLHFVHAFAFTRSWLFTRFVTLHHRYGSCTFFAAVYWLRVYVPHRLLLQTYRILRFFIRSGWFALRVFAVYTARYAFARSSHAFAARSGSHSGWLVTTFRTHTLRCCCRLRCYYRFPVYGSPGCVPHAVCWFGCRGYRLHVSRTACVTTCLLPDCRFCHYRLVHHTHSVGLLRLHCAHRTVAVCSAVDHRAVAGCYAVAYILVHYPFYTPFCGYAPFDSATYTHTVYHIPFLPLVLRCYSSYRTPYVA